jgi:hypothetical protein
MVRFVVHAVLVVGLMFPASVRLDSRRPTLDWSKRTLAHVALPVRFEPAPTALLRQCRRTARAVGYAVPCPSSLPSGLTGTQVEGGPCSGFRFGIVGLPCPAGSQSWHGWIVGSSQLATGTTSFQHLVIQAGIVRIARRCGRETRYRSLVGEMGVR